jgi:hypothetical protein
LCGCHSRASPPLPSPRALPLRSHLARLDFPLEDEGQCPHPLDARRTRALVGCSSREMISVKQEFNIPVIAWRGNERGRVSTVGRKWHLLEY